MTWREIAGAVNCRPAAAECQQQSTLCRNSGNGVRTLFLSACCVARRLLTTEHDRQSFDHAVCLLGALALTGLAPAHAQIPAASAVQSLAVHPQGRRIRGAPRRSIPRWAMFGSRPWRWIRACGSPACARKLDTIRQFAAQCAVARHRAGELRLARTGHSTCPWKSAGPMTCWCFAGPRAAANPSRAADVVAQRRELPGLYFAVRGPAGRSDRPPDPSAAARRHRPHRGVPGRRTPY